MEINIKMINQEHNKAMELAQIASIYQKQGKISDAKKLFNEAFNHELTAALELIQTTDKEPTRSILFRSAASLAKKCSLFSEANDLANLGINGNPPDKIKDELNELLVSLKFVTKVSKTEGNSIIRLAARTKSKLTEAEIEEIKKRFQNED